VSAVVLEPYQQRVVDEKTQLDEKLNKLVEFIGGLQFARLDDIDRNLLLQQRLIMTNYSAVLNKRINRFTSKEPKS
jgi:hypothetical protein